MNGGGVNLKRIDQIDDKVNILHSEFERLAEVEEKVVVLLVGWLGCKKRYMDKYAQVYHKYGIDTVSLLNNRLFYLKENKSQVDALVKILRKKCEDENVVIIVHLFSDNGFRTYGEILNALRKDENVIKRFQCLVFDSCPPRSTLGLHARSYSAILGTRVLSKRWKITLNREFYYHWLFYPIFYFLSFIFFYCCCFIKKPRSVYDDILMTNARLKLPILFIYSEMDFSCPHGDVELFIEKQRRVSKGLIMTKKFKDSFHVSHMRKYPKDYWQAIQKFYKETTDLDLLKEYNVLFDE